MHGTILMVTDGDDRYTPCTSDDVWEYIGNNMYYDGTLISATEHAGSQK